MSRRYKVKFEDDGTRCLNNLDYLRKHPDCGVRFIDDKPFVPIKPIKPKPSPIPPSPIPPIQPSELPQDATNNFRQQGRTLIGDYYFHNNYDRLQTIGNDNYSHEELERPTRPGEVEMEDFGAGVGIPNERPRAIVQTRINPIADPRDTEFRTDFDRDLIPNEINISDLPREIKEYILQKINVRDNTHSELLEFEGESIFNISSFNVEDEKGIKTILTQVEKDIEEENEIKIRTGTYDDDEIEELFSLKNMLEKQLKNLQIKKTKEKIINESRSDKLKPRGMTDEELIEAQIQQLTRNSTPEEAEIIKKNIKKGKQKVKITEQEMFPIEPLDEYKVITEEVQKILKGGETELTISQKNNILKNMENRGISRERTLQVLEEAEVFDPQLERLIGGSSDIRIERLARVLRSGLRDMPRRDTNLLPERQEEIELREETPLTRGRTDIARGRSRIEKVMDKTAARLPEELREIYSSKKIQTGQVIEDIRTRALEARQKVVSNITEVLGQQYKTLPVDIELTDTNISVRPPITEREPVTQLDFDPLGEEYGSQFLKSKPKLSYAERLSQVRTGTLETGALGAGAVGGVLLGGLAGYGLNKLLKNPDNLGVQTAIGGASGAVGDVGARILTMAGTKALTRTGVEIGTETATQAFIRGSTSMLRGAGEGALVGAALTPVDILLNKALVNSGMSHLGANVTSGTIVGGAGVAGTAIGLAALGAAPETLGASLVIGGIAVAVSDIIGGIFGAKEDAEKQKRINEAKKASAEDIQYSYGRTELLKSLPKNNYNIYEAIENYPNVDELGMMSASWDIFLKQSQSIFVPRPKIIEPSNTNTNEVKDKKLNDYFNKFITHSLIKDSCENGNCGDLKKQDPGKLTDDEYKYLNDKTFETWLPRATQQVVMIKEELKYKQQRIVGAKRKLLNAWNRDGKVANQLDPYLVQTAFLDPDFKNKYELALKIDAQQKVIDAYQKDQTKIEELPKNIQDLVNQDPEFTSKINDYYSIMESNAQRLNLSVKELVYLQKLKPEEQKNQYQELQFTDLQINEKVVDEAKQIDKQTADVKEQGFYDIDQMYLEKDPTDITSWKPSDSQILQAHSAGMTLQEYTDYMHQLSLGFEGDYEKIPKYSQAESKASGILDYTHFQDELQTAGYSKDLYLYNSDTKQFTLNPNVRTNVIPNTQNKFIPRYIPSKLAKARQEYADMIHGVNENIQSQVDNYNNNLSKELSSYGKHFEEIAANYNNNILHQGRSDLIHYDAQQMYNQNKLEFKPVDNTPAVTPESTPESTQTAS